MLSFPYTNGQGSVAVNYVRVRHADGTVVTTPAENIRDMPADVSRIAPMYSDAMLKQVVVKGLGVGDTLEYDVRYRQLKPDVPNQFWFSYIFQRTLICKQEELEISVPQDEASLNVYSPGLKPVITEAPGRRIYRWQTSNPVAAAPAAPDPDAPGAMVQVSTFQSWQDVGAWYAGVQKPMVQATPAVKAKEAEVTKGLSNDEARIRALYDFVSTQIHYVSISFGAGRYQPHSPDEVLANGYGDCKDKHTLLAALLQAAGIAAWPALVNSNGQVSKAVPSPGQFDHMITVVPRNGAWLWLDSTTGVAPMGWLAPALRDHPALVISEGKPAALANPPADLPFDSFDDFNMTGTLSQDGTLTAHATSRNRGDAEVVLRAAFRTVPQAQWDKLMQTLLPFMGFGGTGTNVQTAGLDNAAQPFQITFDYIRSGFADWANQHTQPALPPVILPDRPKDAGKPVELGGKRTLDYTSAITLPAGYTLTAPAGIDLTEDFAEYHTSYSFTKNTLTTERRLVVKKDKVAPAESVQYDAFVKAMQDEQGQWINLIPPAGAAGSNAAAASANLINQGYAALQAGQYQTARDELRQAMKLDPSSNNGWEDLGFADLDLGHGADAEADFRHVIALNANDPYAYNNLGRALEQQNKLDQAEAAFRRQIAITAEDRYAHANLGALLLREKKYGDAADELRHAAVVADSANIEYQLGEAEFELHQPDAAEAAMDRAVEKQPSPLMFNNVAYQLADHGVEMAKAKQYAQSAVSSLEGLLAGVELKDLQRTQLGDVTLLGLSWDTLGWIDYQQGDLADAESYIAAAWSLTEDAVEADHLGQVYEKQGRTAAAEAIYAAVGLRGPAHARARLAALAGSADRADQLTAQHLGDASKARTFTVRRLVTGRASADFFVSIVPGPSVHEVKFIQGDESLRPAASLIAALKLSVSFPAHDNVQLIRRGTLYCGDDTAACEFVLLPAGDAAFRSPQ